MNRVPVDFDIVCYGLAVSVIEEDQESVQIQLPRERIYRQRNIGRPHGGECVRGRHYHVERLHHEDLPSSTRYGPSIGVRGGTRIWRAISTFFPMPHSAAKLRTMGPQFRWNTPFHYDPMATLRSDTVPQLWIIGGEDYQAPSAETRRRLNTLIAENRPFTIAYYPHAEHGMTLFENAPDGSRISTRYVAGYFQMIRDFAADGRLQGT